MKRKARFSAACSANTHLEGGTRGYLDLSQLLLLLPVPNRQDVIVGIIHSAQERAAVLKGREAVRCDYFLSRFTPRSLHTVDLLTDLEKATHVTALSNTPIPIT